MKITDFSVKNSQFTFIIFCLVMALGVDALLNMPRAEDPAFAPPGYTVSIIYPGAGPAEIENKITDKLEERLGSLENIERMNSVSLNGVMVLTIEFLYGQDPVAKYEEVLREVNAARVELPENIYRIDVRRFSSSDVNIIQSGIVSENASYADMRREAERLEEDLEKIPAIKGAETWGYPKREVRIQLHLAKMAAAGIPMTRILGALQSENISIPGGAVDIGERRFFVETSGDYENIEEIRNTVVNANNGRILYLKELADIDWAYEEPRYLARINGTRCVWVTARMKDGQNIVKTGEQVEKKIEAWRSALPPEMDYVKVFDQKESVSKRLGRFAKDFGIAILLVLLTLIPLGWRAALVVMISIPLSIAMGVFALDKLGYSLNQLSIVGFIIALGILVDDSIVVVENIERWLREGHSKREAAIEATRQIGLAVLGCTATLVLAFLPLVFLPDDSGDFIRSLPMAVVVTILASLIVSLTIVPFLSSRLLASHHNPQGNIFFRGLKWLIAGSYARVLHQSLRHPWWAIGIAFLLFAGVTAMAGKAGFSIFPASERPMFYIDVEAAPGSGLQQTDRITALVDSVLHQYVVPAFKQHHLLPDSISPVSVYQGGKAQITWYASNIGRGNPRVYYNVIRESESVEFGQVFVQLQERTPAPVKIAFIDELRAQFANVPGAVINVKNFEQGPPVEAPIAIRIFGDHLDTLRHLAAQVETLVSGTEGTIYTDNPIATIKTDLFIHINKDKAASLGIPVAEIDRMVRLAIAGLKAGSFTNQEDGLEYNLTLTVPKAGTSATLQALESVYINNVMGGAVPLNQVAEITLKPSPNTITHYDRERYTLVSAFVKNGWFATGINNELSKKLAAMPFPRGYRYVVAGEAESAQRTFGGMGTIVLVTIFGLLAVLILEFRTFKSTFIVLSVIPLGIIGAVLILFATGYPFSFTVVVGLIALMGIEVKNSILLVDFTNQLRKEGRTLDEAIQEAGEIRFVPILLTSLTAIGGLLPIALEENPLYSPLAYVLIGGLISSTLLSRIVTPVLYKVLAPKVV